MKKMKRKTRFSVFSFFLFCWAAGRNGMVESPRSGQLTYPGNLRVVGGSLLDIHRASREREREMVGNMLYTRINTFSKSKEERNSARSHRRARNKCRMWQHEERTRLESLLDLTAVERRNKKKKKKGRKRARARSRMALWALHLIILPAITGLTWPPRATPGSIYIHTDTIAPIITSATLFRRSLFFLSTPFYLDFLQPSPPWIGFVPFKKCFMK